MTTLPGRDTQVRSLSVAADGGTLDRGALLLTQSARYPVIAAAIAGPGASELTLVVLSGQPDGFNSRPQVTVERVSAVNGALLGVEYRPAVKDGEWQAKIVAISADPSGRYQLFSDGGRFRSGWIDQGRIHPLPLKHPNPELSIAAW